MSQSILCIFGTLILTTLAWLPATNCEANAITPARLVVAHDSRYEPYSYLGEDGQPQGYLIEFWNHFGKTNGVEIAFKLGTWQESLDMVKLGEADIHGGLFYSVERDTFLDFGPGITSLASFLYVHKDLSAKERKECAVGVVKGGFEEFFMRTQYPERQLKPYPQNEDLLKAAARNELLAFLADQPTAVFYLRRLNIEKTFIPSEELYSKSLRPAVREGDDVLLEFIDSGWGKMDPNVLRVIHDKWFLKKDIGWDWFWPALGLAAVLILAALSMKRLARRFQGLG